MPSDPYACPPVLKLPRCGWLRSQMYKFDNYFSNRWGWWLGCLADGEIGDKQIPQIDFGNSPYTAKLTELDRCLKASGFDGKSLTEQLGTKQSVRAEVDKLIARLSHTRHPHSAARLLADTLLYGFMDKGAKLPTLTSDEETALAYAMVDLVPKFMAHPDDWASYILQHVYPNGSGLAWFPTPIELAKLMAAMLHTGDNRFQTVHEPCVGTGVTLLAASNYSLRLCGQDVDADMVAWCKIQMYLYVPWVIIPGDNIIKEFVRADAEEKARPRPKPKIRLKLRKPD